MRFPTPNLLRQAFPLALGLVALLATAVTSSASPVPILTSIPIENPGFEADLLAPGQYASTLVGWDTSPGGGDGALNPADRNYPNAAAPEGENVAYANLPGNRVRQVLTTVLEPSTIYLLRAKVGHRLDEPFVGYRVQLLAGGTLLAQDTGARNPLPGQFVESMVVFFSSATEPLVGQPLEIQLKSAGIQANFDDIHLDAVRFGRAVTVLNPGFEEELLNPGELRQTITGWETSPGGGDGVFRPTSDQYPEGVAEGVNVAWANEPGNRVHQVLAETLRPRTRYVLEVEVGARAEERYVGYRVQLWAGGELLAEDVSSQVPAPGEFVTARVGFEVERDDPRVGERLEILLRSEGTQANFDDVRLMALPEVVFGDGFESARPVGWTFVE